MSKNKTTKKSDANIVAILEHHILFTTGYADSNLVKERTKVLEYYDGIRPLPTHKGNSKYVSQDVYESVESAKATLLEVFSTSHKIVWFDPSGPQDVEPARIATEFCSYIVYRQNPGQSIFNEVITDGLLARAGIVQFSWEEDVDDVEEQVGPATMQQLSMHPAIQDDSTNVDSLDDHGDGTFTANITKKQNKGYVHLECVPPEDFGITSRARDIKSCKLCYRRHTKTRGELLFEGYSASLIDKLPKNTIDYDLDQEKAARFALIEDQRIATDDSMDLTDDSDTYELMDCYARMDIDGNGIPKLWRIVKCGNYILEKEKVSARPFAVFVPTPKAHSFYGTNFATKAMPIQNARTVLTRAILDHTLTTTAPRWQVVKGGLINARELMDQRVGGLVNVTRPDAVLPLQQAPLNPFVFQTIQMMDQNKEDATGMSKLSKGLNRDAISFQNSQGLVEDLVALSDRRMKLIARQFAEFLRDLYVGIYQLVLDHHDFKTEIEVAGDFVSVDPRQWRSRTMVSAEMAVGWGEMDKLAEKWAQIDQYLSNPAFAPMYTPQQRYVVARRGLEAKGVKDVDNILLPPQKWQAPPPDPKMQAEIASLQADARCKLITAQATQTRTEFEAKKWTDDHKLRQLQEIDDLALASDAQALKERMQVHRENVDAAELALQKLDIEKSTKDAATAFLHPNG